jgi:polysaccharide pyruvyl transferase WcaK-like protein
VLGGDPAARSLQQLRRRQYFHKNFIDFMDGAPRLPCVVWGGGTLVRGGGGAGQKYEYEARQRSSFVTTEAREAST